MNAKFLIPLVAAMLFSLPAHGHDCSGGANGGMDATGNQCNDAAAVAMVAPSGGTTVSSTSAPKVATNKTASCSTCAVKRTVATRSATGHQRIHRG